MFLLQDDYKPWEEQENETSDDEIREAFTKAVKKRMMADVDYGFFLSGGIDSAVVSDGWWVYTFYFLEQGSPLTYFF